MARVFDVALLAADPYVDAIELDYLGARKVDLDTLVRSPISSSSAARSTRRRGT